MDSFRRFCDYLKLHVSIIKPKVQRTLYTETNMFKIENQRSKTFKSKYENDGVIANPDGIKI